MEKKNVQHQVHLDAAAHLLAPDNLVTEAGRAGLDNHLQRWIEDLKEVHDNEHLHPIITDLQALKAHFGSGTLDGQVISRLLHRLADNTALVAHLADGNAQPRVVALSSALAIAAAFVAGGATSPQKDLQHDSAENR